MEKFISTICRATETLCAAEKRYEDTLAISVKRAIAKGVTQEDFNAHIGKLQEAIARRFSAEQAYEFAGSPYKWSECMIYHYEVKGT